MATDTGVSSRNRPTLSCARCYLMKKKCDKKVPSCSRCDQAGTPCLGINRSSKTEVPRSAVRYLEERLAEVEAQRAVGQNDHLREHRSDPSWSEHAAHRDGNSRAAVLEIASLAMGSVCTSSLLQPDLGIYYEGKLFYTSERPPLKIPVRGIYNEEPPRKASKGSEFRLPDMGALKIPFKVATALFNNYISNVLPRYPCFLESDLLEHFNQFYKDGNPESVSSDTTWFIISMVLAISSLTSKAHDFRKVSSLGESLQRDALRRSSFLGSSSMRSLQCFLLLIQMALLLPYAANLWYMSGEAMRMAIALGLHQEVDGNPEIDSGEVNLRRSVFWTVYQLERTIAIASGCPLAISDEHISTMMPSDIPNEPSGLLPSRSGRNRLSQFLHHVQLCQMQSEIHGVQFFDQELPTDTTDYDEWVKKMEKSIQIWQDNSGSDAVLPEWSVNAANHSRLLLYRPCSRNIIPPDSSLQAASRIATRMIHDYWNLAQGGSLAFSFQSVYNVFHAAMILLYALRNHGQILRDCHLEEEARQGLHLLPQVFAVLSVRWPVAMDTGRYVEDLKETILRTLDLGDDSEQSGYDMDFLGELDFMITQRRIHSVYHRNVEIHAPAERVASDRSPWSQVDPFTPVSDELWQEFITASFEFLSDNCLPLIDAIEPEPTGLPADNIGDTGPFLAQEVSELHAPIEVEAVIHSLPACRYCRSQHLRCDREFPSCGACAKSARDCVYYDAVLQQDIPRSYIYDLYARLKATEQHSADDSGVFLRTGNGTKCSDREHFLLPCTVDSAISGPIGSINSQSQDSATLNTWFFGSPSTLAFLHHTITTNRQWPFQDHRGTKRQSNPQIHFQLDYPDISLPPISVVAALFGLFERSVNVFYPMVKGSQLHSIMENLYKNSPERAAPVHDRVIFYLILAIGSQLAKSQESGLPFSPGFFFRRAIRLMDKSRQSWIREDQLSLLQRTLLICLYLLLNPASGDIWRNLGFAVRLYFDLSHRPSEDDDLDEELLYMISRSLYCIECQVSLAFGRPSLLVIGDNLRDSMTNQLSETASDRISASFYRISLLKMQIGSIRLSGAASQSFRAESSANYRRQADIWLKDWQEELQIMQTKSAGGMEQDVSLLEAWGNLQYYHAALLASDLLLTGEDDLLDTLDQIVRACGTLARDLQKCAFLTEVMVSSPLAPIFTLNWTVAHLLFSAGLRACTWGGRRPASGIDATAIARRCITTLALLEGDPANLSVGFTEVLERMLDDTCTSNS